MTPLLITVAVVAGSGALAWLLFFANRRAFPWERPQPAADERRGGVVRTTLMIPTLAGEIIEAWLYKPNGPPAPVVIMAPGLAGTKEGPLERFAWAFAQAGFAALAFDFRSFGGSGGSPRQNIDPRAAVEDFTAVLAHVRAGHAPGVNANRIVSWGTSFSGAAAIVAAESSAVEGAILHVPYLGKPAKPPGFMQMVGYVGLVTAEMAGDGLARLAGIRLRPCYIAAYGKPGEGAFGASRDCPSRRGGPATHPFWSTLPKAYRGGWRNLMLVRALQHLDATDPAKALGNVACPVLVLAATRDDMIDIVDTREMCAAAPGVELVEIDAGHFDPYVDPCFETSLAAQMAFLRQTLAQDLPSGELEEGRREA